MKYTNPIIPGANPDPSICVVGNDYYLTVSMLEFFPGAPIYHSTDMINWELIGHALTRKSQLDLDRVPLSTGCLGTNLRYHDGTFYAIGTQNKFGNFYVTATDPKGPWSEPIVVDSTGIDPDLFFDEGKVYFISNHCDENTGENGIYMAEIDIETGKLLSDLRFVTRGTGGLAIEGPHIYKIDGMYYFMFAEGGTRYGHMSTMFRSESLWGPYEGCPHNPIVTHRNKFHEIQGLGKSDLVQDLNGDWWVVCHAFRKTTVNALNWHHLGRETFLLPVEWENGWPVVNQGNGAEINMDIDRIIAPQKQNFDFYDDFSKEEPDKRYLFIRNPLYENYQFLSDRNVLRLIPTESTLKDDDGCTFIGVRQQQFDIDVSVNMHFAPTADNDEAGVSVYRNTDSYINFCIKRKNGKKYLCVTQHLGELQSLPCEMEVDFEDVKLHIRADRYKYYFEYSDAASQKKQFSQGESRFLGGEVCYGPWSGVCIGMYSTGSTYAEFKNFSYKDVVSEK